MQPVSVPELNSFDFALSDISAIDLVPVRRNVRQRPPVGRALNGFLYLLEGACRFSFSGKSFDLAPGGLVYLPHHSVHQYGSLSESVRYLRIDFTMTRTSDGAEVLLSNLPMRLFSDTPLPLRALLRSLTDAFTAGSFGSRIKCTSLLYDVFHELAVSARRENLQNTETIKVLPAVEYLESHAEQEPTTEFLASLCGFSPAYFRTLFKAVTEMTPTDYRTKLRVDKACQYLKNQSCSISELSAQLGFSSVYYFCRIFRRMTGVSPGKYRGAPQNFSANNSDRND